MSDGRLLESYSDISEIVRIQSCIIDRLFLALSEAADVQDEDLLMIRRAARMREEAEVKGII